MLDKIYPQAVHGFYRKTKDYVLSALLFIYFGGSWLRWSRAGDSVDQAVMIDLPNRKGYLFSIIIWPDEVYYLAGALIMAALGLFFFTSIFGRLWCGYTCIHTVFSDIFHKIEHYFQGDRNSRMSLDKKPMDRDKLYKKAKTHIAWLIVSFAFAFGWVCYFYDAPTLLHDLLSLQVSANGSWWLLGLTFSTYIFAGYAKEKVCIYMCPYGRFQSAMLDDDTSVVTYHVWRGEPRGHINKDDKVMAAGDCIDCHKCVVVCPMGIDIRNGLQMACIGCGLCIDACNSVMETLGRPKDLIFYDSVNSTAAKQQGAFIKRTVLKFKTILFVTVFAVVFGVMIWALLNKAPFSVGISRADGPLVTIIPDGSRRNTFQLLLVNRGGALQKLHFSVE